jgi:hypothetical protein
LAPAVLAGVFMPLRNRVVADTVGSLIEFEILLVLDCDSLTREDKYDKRYVCLT